MTAWEERSETLSTEGCRSLREKASRLARQRESCQGQLPAAVTATAMEPERGRYNENTFGVVGQTLDSKPLLKDSAEKVSFLCIIPHFDHATGTPDGEEGLIWVAGDGTNGFLGLYE